MKEYLKIGDEGCFQDLTKQTPDLYKEIIKKEPQECLVCFGYGRWNLKLNAYGPGRHFQSICVHCNSWGYVDKHSSDATCIHFQHSKTLTQEECRERKIPHRGMCYYVHECTECGKIWSYDSGD